MHIIYHQSSTVHANDMCDYSGTGKYYVPSIMQISAALLSCSASSTKECLRIQNKCPWKSWKYNESRPLVKNFILFCEQEQQLQKHPTLKIKIHTTRYTAALIGFLDGSNIGSTISGRNLPLYCTLIPIAMQVHQNKGKITRGTWAQYNSVVSMFKEKSERT